jgi:hypothetical protein
MCLYVIYILTRGAHLSGDRYGPLLWDNTTMLDPTLLRKVRLVPWKGSGIQGITENKPRIIDCGHNLYFIKL